MKFPSQTNRPKANALDPAVETALRALLAAGDLLDAKSLHSFEELLDGIARDNGRISDVLYDLVNDLAYFVPDPKMRSQDPSYFGADKAHELIAEAVREIDTAHRSGSW
jgi:hypothetical protein